MSPGPPRTESARRRPRTGTTYGARSDYPDPVTHSTPVPAVVHGHARAGASARPAPGRTRLRTLLENWAPTVATTIVLLALTLPLISDYGVLPTISATLMCIAGGLAIRRPVPAGVLVGAVLTATTLSLLLPRSAPAPLGPATFAAPVTVTLCAAHGRRRAALLLSAWHTVALASSALTPTADVRTMIWNLAIWGTFSALAVAAGVWIHRLIDNIAAERTQRVLDLAEQRRALARELHDTAVRATTEVVLHAERAARRADADPGSIEEFSRISRTARLATDDLRALMETLRESESLDPGLHDMPLRVSTWQDVLHSTRDRLLSEGFTVRLHHDGDAPLPPRLLNILERSLQEVRANIERHGDRRDAVAIMSEIDARLPAGANPDTMRPGVDLVILNGIAPTQNHISGGAGLPGVRERLAVVDGVLEAKVDGARFLTHITIPKRMERP